MKENDSLSRVRARVSYTIVFAFTASAKMENLLNINLFR